MWARNVATDVIATSRAGAGVVGADQHGHVLHVAADRGRGLAGHVGGLGAGLAVVVVAAVDAGLPAGAVVAVDAGVVAGGERAGGAVEVPAAGVEATGDRVAQAGHRGGRGGGGRGGQEREDADGGGEDGEGTAREAHGDLRRVTAE